MITTFRASGLVRERFGSRNAHAVDPESHLKTAMNGYHYELPTTEPLSFSSCYGDVVGSYIAQVADTTERRANLRTLLKDTKRNSEKDYLKLVKVLARPHRCCLSRGC
jgi:hypothetical protein